MKPNIFTIYVANPHGLEVEHWSANPNVPGSNLSRSTFFLFFLFKNPLSKFRPLFGLFGLGYGQNAPDYYIRGHFELI